MVTSTLSENCYGCVLREKAFLTADPRDCNSEARMHRIQRLELSEDQTDSGRITARIDIPNKNPSSRDSVRPHTYVRGRRYERTSAEMSSQAASTAMGYYSTYGNLDQQDDAWPHEPYYNVVNIHTPDAPEYPSSRDFVCPHTFVRRREYERFLLLAPGFRGFYHCSRRQSRYL